MSINDRLSEDAFRALNKKNKSWKETKRGKNPNSRSMVGNAKLIGRNSELRHDITNEKFYNFKHY